MLSYSTEMGKIMLYIKYIQNNYESKTQFFKIYNVVNSYFLHKEAFFRNFIHV